MFHARPKLTRGARDRGARPDRHRRRPLAEPLEARDLPASFTLFAAGNTGGGSGDPGNVELWRTDGTPRGTRLVKDINPGRASSNPLDLTYIPQLKTWFFTADNGRNGRELWKSNGTAAGTKMVKNIYTGRGVDPSGMDRNIAPFFTYCNGYVYFVANGGPQKGGVELWRTNGTAAGTRIVRNIKHREEGSVPAKLTAVGRTLYFVADDGFHQRELWKTDGTPRGTKMVKDIRPGNIASDIKNLVAVGNRLFFSADDGKHGAELWVSDGTAAGTRMVKDINDVAVSNAYPSNPRWLTAYKGKVYFAAYREEYGRELWVSDGTEAGTKLVKDIAPTITDDFDTTIVGSSNPANLTVYKNRLYFSTLVGPSEVGAGSALYSTDGTEAGTRLVKQINTASFDSEEPNAVHLEPMRFTVAGNYLYFIAGTRQDFVSATNENVELWRTNGTAGGTFQVRDIFPFNFGSSKPSKLRAVGRKLFFFAYTENHGREPWVSAGSRGTTKLLKDINRTRRPGTSHGQGSESYGISFGSYQFD